LTNPLVRIPRAVPVDEWQVGTSPLKGIIKKTYGQLLVGLQTKKKAG